MFENVNYHTVATRAPLRLFSNLEIPDRSYFISEAKINASLFFFLPSLSSFGSYTMFAFTCDMQKFSTQNGNGIVLNYKITTKKTATTVKENTKRATTEKLQRQRQVINEKCSSDTAKWNNSGRHKLRCRWAATTTIIDFNHNKHSYNT